MAKSLGTSFYGRQSFGRLIGFRKEAGAVCLYFGHFCIQRRCEVLVHVHAVDIQSGNALALGGKADDLQHNASNIVPALHIAHTVHKRQLNAIVVPTILGNGQNGLITVLPFALGAVVKHQTKAASRRIDGADRRLSERLFPSADR